MLSAEEIINLVKGGEGYNVDFKQSVPSKVRELTEEVCSFLNASGGSTQLQWNRLEELLTSVAHPSIRL